MRITRLAVKGFRSLADVDLRDLGPRVVLYGPNGSGKSNLLEAIAVLQRGLEVSAAAANPGHALPLEGLGLRERDATTGRPLETMTILCEAVFPAAGPLVGLEVNNDPPPVLAKQRLFLDLRATVLGLGGVEFTVQLRLARYAHPPLWSSNDRHDHRRRTVLAWLAERFYTRVDAVRAVRGQRTSDERLTVAQRLARGEVARALVDARVHPDLAVRKGLEALQGMLSRPPLSRPPFDPVRDPATGEDQIHERVHLDDGSEVSLPVDLAGLGIQQVYVVLATILLGGRRIAAVEEPEAHLHAPTTGRILRTLLQELLSGGHVDQIWIATHSNLFDLDPDGYWDVALEPGRGTVVTRRELAAIDERHLYEPGPAKHAVQDLMRLLPDDAALFARPDGTPVRKPELMELLRDDEALALEFLREVHRTAVAIVQRASARRAKS